MKIFQYQITGSEKSLQPTGNTERKGPHVENAFVPRDVRRSAWELFIEHDRCMKEVQALTGLKERQVRRIVRARIHEEIDRAVAIDRLRRGPQGPTPLAPGLRRAA